MSACGSSGSSADTASIGLPIAERRVEIVGGQAEFAQQAKHLRLRIVPAPRTLSRPGDTACRGSARRTADQIGDDEHRRRNSFALENRQRQLVDVPIAIVKRDRRDRFLEGQPVQQAIADLVERDEAERPAETIEMPLEHLEAGEHARHLDPGFRFEMLDDAVIADHERPIRIARPGKTMVVRLRNGGGDRCLHVAAQAANLRRHGITGGPDRPRLQRRKHRPVGGHEAGDDESARRYAPERDECCGARRVSCAQRNL